jgi:hypothetical protein
LLSSLIEFVEPELVVRVVLVVVAEFVEPDAVVAVAV